MSMANFDLIEYQKRVINDLTAENKALKDQLRGKCSACVHYSDLHENGKCKDCYWDYNAPERLIEYLCDNWKWKGVDGK